MPKATQNSTNRIWQILVSFQLDLLYLKLQHMEKSKFITANDFFPINYAMLYNVSEIPLYKLLVK